MAEPANQLLVVSNLKGGYHRKEIIHGIDFSIGKGELVCVIGANGCGKTTLVKTILGLLKPFVGTIEVNGQDAAKLTVRERAQHFAYIPQLRTPPFSFKVADVVLLGRTPYINRLSVVSDEDRAIALRSLEMLSIADLALRSYSHLSGGQQQLILIARALAQQPDILVMDEPTASLDFGNQHAVLSSMRSLVDSGTSVLMVTHDPGHAFFCADRVLAMRDGALIADGSPQDVITAETMYEVYGVNMQIIEAETVSGQKTRACIPLP